MPTDDQHKKGQTWVGQGKGQKKEEEEEKEEEAKRTVNNKREISFLVS